MPAVRLILKGLSDSPSTAVQGQAVVQQRPWLQGPAKGAERYMPSNWETNGTWLSSSDLSLPRYGGGHGLAECNKAIEAENHQMGLGIFSSHVVTWGMQHAALVRGLTKSKYGLIFLSSSPW